jgi:hypothetical protein
MATNPVTPVGAEKTKGAIQRFTVTTSPAPLETWDEKKNGLTDGSS